MAQDTLSTYRAPYPNIFVRMAIGIPLVLGALLLSFLIPDIAPHWRVAIVVGLGVTASSAIFYWMDRRRRS